MISHFVKRSFSIIREFKGQCMLSICVYSKIFRSKYICCIPEFIIIRFIDSYWVLKVIYHSSGKSIGKSQAFYIMNDSATIDRNVPICFTVHRHSAETFFVSSNLCKPGIRRNTRKTLYNMLIC